jgi:hypothetical protein
MCVCVGLGKYYIGKYVSEFLHYEQEVHNLFYTHCKYLVIILSVATVWFDRQVLQFILQITV